MNNIIHVTGYTRRKPAKKPDPLVEELRIGRELVSELEAKLPDWARADLDRILETY